MSFNELLPVSQQRRRPIRTSRDPYKIIYDVVIFKESTYNEWLEENNGQNNLRIRPPQSNKARWGYFSTRREISSMISEFNIASYDIESLTQAHTESLAGVEKTVYASVQNIDEFQETHSTLNLLEIKAKCGDIVEWNDSARYFDFFTALEQVSPKGRPVKVVYCTLYYIVRTPPEYVKVVKNRKEFSVLLLVDNLGDQLTDTRLSNIVQDVFEEKVSIRRFDLFGISTNLTKTLEVIGSEKSKSNITLNVMNIEQDPSDSHYFIYDDKFALLDVKELIGTLDSGRNIDPKNTSSSGIGQAINNAISRGVTDIAIVMNDVGCMDGGFGLLVQLGAKFHSISGAPIRPMINTLDEIESADLSAVLEKLANINISVICNNYKPICSEDDVRRTVEEYHLPSSFDPEEFVESLDSYVKLLDPNIYHKRSTSKGIASGNFMAASLAAVGATLCSCGEFVLASTDTEALAKGYQFVILATDDLNIYKDISVANKKIYEACTSASVPCCLLCSRIDLTDFDESTLKKMPPIFPLISESTDITSSEEVKKSAKYNLINLRKALKAAGLKAKLV